MWKTITKRFSMEKKNPRLSKNSCFTMLSIIRLEVTSTYLYVLDSSRTLIFFLISNQYYGFNKDGILKGKSLRFFFCVYESPDTLGVVLKSDYEFESDKLIPISREGRKKSF